MAVRDWKNLSLPPDQDLPHLSAVPWSPPRDCWFPFLWHLHLSPSPPPFFFLPPVFPLQDSSSFLKKTLNVTNGQQIDPGWFGKNKKNSPSPVPGVRFLHCTRVCPMSVQVPRCSLSPSQIVRLGFCLKSLPLSINDRLINQSIHLSPSPVQPPKVTEWSAWTVVTQRKKKVK